MIHIPSGAPVHTSAPPEATGPQVHTSAPLRATDAQVAPPSPVPESPFRRYAQLPAAQGLYQPEQEKDACGLAIVATLRGEPGHDIVDAALTALRNLEHRGAVGADEGTGDGAGLLTQIPDEFFRAVTAFALPAAGQYAVGTAFLPPEAAEAELAKAGLEALAEDEGLTVLGWREVPIVEGLVGAMAKACMPRFVQLFVAMPQADADPAVRLDTRQPATGQPDSRQPNDSQQDDRALDAKAFRLRKRAQNKFGVYFPSLSSRTIVYKGMLTTAQLEPFYPDLSDSRFKTRLGIVHSRFSTNTFPSWPLAQPFRTIAHNGEINTVKGNRNWMRARQSTLSAPLLGDTPEDLFPICTPGASDSASFDEVAELLWLAGRPITQAIMMMLPEAWENHATMDPARRAFYEYHSMLMEPWDGPAAVSFTDGTMVGATLDRNGLRPGRYWITEDGLIIFASEVGVIDIEPAKVVKKGRVSPGKMFLVDTDAGRVISDSEIKDELAGANPWGEWVRDNVIKLADLPEREHVVYTRASVNHRQRTFGYTQEELRILIGPMARSGAEPLGAMGSDTPIAVLSQRPRLLFDYFVQSFAQVTNPPLDAIREELVTSLNSSIGPQGNLLSLQEVRQPQLALPFPVINNDELAKIANIENPAGDRVAVRVRGLYKPDGGEGALRARLAEICEQVSGAINRGVQYVVLSDRDSNAQWAPIPSLLLLSAVHHHLLRSANRTKTALVVEAGDVREVHHVAALVGYGAAAVNPYLAMESVEELIRTGDITGVSAEEGVYNLIKGLGKGVLKIMSKMGISTVASYCGAQTFEALGLSQDLVDEFFSGTNSQLGGIGLGVIAAEVAARHAMAYPADGVEEPHRPLLNGGEYQWRREGEPHLFNPDTVFRLQHATRERRYDIFKQYTSGVDDQSKNLMTLRGLLKFKDGVRPGVPIDEVESVASIVKRFSTGAMSYGSISQEAHETLAIAMNQLGAKSNTGEGGEDVDRLLDPQRRSAIKQVASGRFGVTSLYLTNATDIQIKMAQGAKPGEGGQLMARKVYPWIASTRHSTPGVGLISPPPHHDIYSIEDLAQLIYDCKRANPSARVHVKLVSEVGIGTVAAGVTKAKADVVLVSGHDGGTGASPLNSLKHAGVPWELGLAETQQTLMLNGLRDRVVVQVDGQLKTGRDVVIAALLGAEEYGFATAPLVVSGCVMMRVCHLDTCPVGVATQNPELRQRFTGKPEFVVNFFEFLAEEVREILAQLGFRSLEEAIGHADTLDARAAINHWKAEGLDLDPILAGMDFDADAPLRNLVPQNHELDKHFDQQLITLSAEALSDRTPVKISVGVVNTDRSVGTMLGYEVTKKFGIEVLATDTIDVTLTGQAGQSLGAFLPAGITLRLFGDSNDYVGKGLSGGRIMVRPDRTNVFPAQDNVIAGNVIGYGATSGEMFLRGQVGERFLVRNSGAVAVVEGIGDHGCEYMTGGQALILGRTGRNFGAGMSGGTAYVLDLQPAKVNIQSLDSGELQLLPLDEQDRSLVRDLLSRHYQETESTLAARLLADFEATAARITKVLPRDYAAVLQTRQDAANEGLDPNGPEVWQRILEVTGG
ncbi:glutamate synthase large subunit [Arthrobacter sp. H14-L1]|uniref:glutamate synthase large subunit n=1 Tax=Arthrobacter sp. H14-L1 TaxID=2996697 RepID=UPI00227049D4|nr:glutamate synthase large subunit [Arthrobacter sp. H14-L1]MCY0904363.1 glutamate synthase large subunit [Arthrobacter sp. H14-L1]